MKNREKAKREFGMERCFAYTSCRVELALWCMGENRWKNDNSRIFVLNRDLNERKETILI
jgi:hypothetical protein